MAGLRGHRLQHEISDENEQIKRDMEKYYCFDCDYMANSKALMNNHIEIKHMPVESFLCQYCSKSFSHIRYCKEHGKICERNPDKQTFKCMYCDNEYSIKKLLNRHQKSAHDWGKK
jgi:hypothetical protein